jgi:deoxyinosine 3'endonuclease (endonuclease V)
MVNGPFLFFHLVYFSHTFCFNYDCPISSGNGVLHPRQFGLACHLGVLADTPCIGVAKNFLHIPQEGTAMEMADVKSRCKTALQKRGDTVELVGSSGFTYGVALRASDAAKNPVFVSQGHSIDLPTAIHIVLSCSKYKNAEPIRMADGLSRQYVRDHYPSS